MARVVRVLLITSLTIIIISSIVSSTCLNRTETGCSVLCDQEDTVTLKCADRSFLGIGFPMNVKEVVLQSVRASTISVAAVSGATNLRRLTWRKSGIEYLETDVFQNTIKLEILDLGDNQLTNLSDNIFSPLRNLRYLYLTHNRIDSIRENSFRGLESLEEIYISNNQLKTIPYQVFSTARQLRVIDISGNYLVSLQANSFSPNKALQDLRLSENKLTMLPSELFSELRQLRYLRLNTNKIYTIPRGLFADLNSLETLDLSDNPITNPISNVALQGLNNLRWLSLAGTNITAVTPDLWRPVPKLSTLDLSRTWIEEIRDGDMAGLTNLRNFTMRNSLLRELTSKALEDTPNLKRVDMRANQLAFLPAALASLPLEELQLSHNPWACDCRMFWFIKWAESHSHNAFETGLQCDTENADMVATLKYLNCAPPSLISVTPTAEYVLLSSVLLECKFGGNPEPSITWVTPSLQVLHWNPDPSFPDAFVRHHSSHRADVQTVDNRVTVLENGSLFINRLLREDVGVYKCFAINPIANATTYVTLHMDRITYYRTKILSIVVGAACATGFLLITLFVQLLRYLFSK